MMRSTVRIQVWMILAFAGTSLVLEVSAESYLSNVSQCGNIIKSYVGKNESFPDAKNGTFSSLNHPHPYPSKTHCRYDFIAASDERIQIVFTDFNLYHPDENNPREGPQKIDKSRDCGGSDVLSTFVYINNQLARIDDYCGSNTPLAAMSNGRKLTLEFNAPHSSRYVRGFNAIFAFVKDFGIRTGRQNSTEKYPCTFIFNSSETSNGTFTSPNYPGLYPRNTECHYLFYGRDGEYVELYFTYFHIDGVQPCDEESHSDYVEFSNYMPVDRKFDRQCGTIKDLKMKSDRKFFRVTFRSNDRYDATGFHATYQFNNVANHLTIRNVRSQAFDGKKATLTFIFIAHITTIITEIVLLT
ncbi:unnamed protein product [Allacma fusca]|uniref:CUB domain-containing protein n=1 Tax=Allacma fusca TaxID=39272 RepID=A0A8J2NVJ1_9HEXA|nr:unnamed protein product [Allacma fusca]